MLHARASGYDIDALIEADRARTESLRVADGLRRRRNEVAAAIARAKKAGGGGGEESAGLIERMKELSAGIGEAEDGRRAAEERYERLARSMPNVLHGSVPVGSDGSANVEVRRWRGGGAGGGGEGGQGEALPAEKARRQPLRDHVDISVARGLVDLERAARAAGARFYYLKGDMVRLNHALISHALDLLAARGYEPVQPPYMLNRRSMDGAVIADDFEDVIYKIDGDDLYLIGTSEHAMAAMHAGEILDGKSLPLRYAGVSPCFRREAGAHGRDQKGIFRVHQFDKVEQFVFARPGESWAEHERMLSVAEEYYKSLGLPHRVVLLSSGDMGKVSAKTYDIEAWMAAQNAYREVVSCSNCLDYQARRLLVRYRDSPDEPTALVHTLNSTVVATTRTMVAIIENFQTGDGRVEVPRPLRRAMGKDYI